MDSSRRAFIMIVVLFGLAVILNLCLGSTSLNWHEVWSQPQSQDGSIFWQLRLPRVVTVILVGAALGAAGVLSQGLFRNPLASPSVLGITSGASAFASLCFLMMQNEIPWFALPAMGFIGALITTLLFVLALRRIPHIAVEHILLMGMAVNSFYAGCTALVTSVLQQEHLRFQTLTYWLMGGFNGRSWDHALLGLVPITLGGLWAWRIIRNFDALCLGEDIAHSLGVAIKKVRWVSLIAIALLVSGAVVIAGAISFVGLIVPHITRLLVGPRHQPLMLASAVNGATLVLIADGLVRVLPTAYELQAGIVLGLVGALFFAILLWRQLQHRGLAL